MPENNFDWSKFTLRVNINTDPQRIYALLSSKSGLEFWFLRRADIYNINGELKSEDKIETGDHYQWYWFGYDDEINEKGSFEHMKENTGLQFSFGLAGTVNINIQQQSGYSMLELTQSNIPVTDEGKRDYHLGCSKGWLFYLTNLKSLLEGGLDLRNKDENIKGVITA